MREAVWRRHHEGRVGLRKAELAEDETVLIEGSANIRDINKLFDWNLNTDEVRTFNGFILEYLEEIPEEGTVCEINGLQITILEVSDNMVKQAKVVKL